MGIKNIKIKNYKSIKNIEYDLSEGKINCLTGKNGVGKSTLEKAILYFYDIANNKSIDKVVDGANPYVQKMSIEIIFDLSEILGNMKSNNYIRESIDPFKSNIYDGLLSIKLTQYKDGRIEWYPINNNYKIRKFLKIFPAFLLSTKKIELLDWQNIWNIISDIGITGFKQDNDKIDDILIKEYKSIYGEKFETVYNSINQIVRDEQFKVNDKDYKNRFKNALLSCFGGSEFFFKEEKVDHYSDGINSLEYLSLGIKLISALSVLSCKDIIIFLDEPEINMHLNYVDELSDIILSSAKKVNFLISTHSTRLVSCLLREYTDENKVICNNVYMKNGYTYMNKIQEIVTNKDRYLIRDNEAECYFSNLIIFVEGMTEVMVLKNKYLVSLFPVLKKVTVYNSNSDSSAIRLIKRTNNKLAIPILNIIDMDKVLKYEKYFKINRETGEINILCDEKIKQKENYQYYSDTKYRTYHLRKQIDSILEVLEKNPSTNFINNKYEKYLIYMIKKYANNNNCVYFKTTIEGALVSKSSLKIFLLWLEKERLDEDKFKKLNNNLNKFSDEEKVVLLRCIVKGKTDHLEKGNKNPEIHKIINNSGYNFKKTDGWVTDYLNWFFINYMKTDDDKKNFKYYFPELYEVVLMVQSMLKYYK